MRSKIFIYLFIFALLALLFQYVNAKKILESKDKELAVLRLQKQEADSLARLQKRSLDSVVYENEGHFALRTDEYARTYFEEQGLNPRAVEQQIEDLLIDSNKANADHPLVPYAGMEGPMRINKIKVINHKWALADFTDGTYWGQLFIQYTLGAAENPEFLVKQSFMYPKP